VSYWQTVTWDTARAAGFVAYGLVALSVALGLVLSLRWRSRAWPRWATNDLHRYVALLALAPARGAPRASSRRRRAVPRRD
jgi:hypothetical protein